MTKDNSRRISHFRGCAVPFTGAFQNRILRQMEGLSTFERDMRYLRARAAKIAR